MRSKTRTKMILLGALGVVLLITFIAILFQAVSKSSAVSVNAPLDEGAYTGLDGVKYNHSYLIGIDSQNNILKIARVNSRGDIYIPNVVEFTLSANTKYDNGGDLVYPSVDVSMSYMDEFGAPSGSPLSVRLQSTYSGYNSRPSLSSNTPRASSGSGSLKLYAEARSVFSFHSGYADFSSFQSVSKLPGASTGAKRLTVATEYSESFSKCSALSSSPLGIPDRIDCVKSGSGGYDSNMATWKSGDTEARVAERYWYSSGPSYFLRWSVPYTNLLQPGIGQTVLVAFNVPDSDGDGADDLDDLAPYDPLISTIERAKTDVEYYSILLKNKQAEYDAIQDEIEHLRSDRGALLEDIASSQDELAVTAEELRSLQTQVSESEARLRMISAELGRKLALAQTNQLALTVLYDKMSILSQDAESNINLLVKLDEEVGIGIEQKRKDTAGIRATVDVVNWAGQEDMKQMIEAYITNMERSLETDEKQHTLLVSTHASLKKNQEDTRAVLSESQARLLDMEKQLQDMQKLANAQGEVLEENKDAIEGMSSILTVLLGKINENSNEISRLRVIATEETKLEAEKAEILEQLVTQTIDLATAQERLRIINSSLSGLRIQAGGDALSKIERLEGENSGLRQRVAELEGKGATSLRLATVLTIVLIVLLGSIFVVLGYMFLEGKKRRSRG